MIKYAILLVNMLALLVVRIFFYNGVIVTMNAPEKVKQGDEITVSLTINKGSIAGVGHLKQELPAGFGSVTAIETKGAEFKYLAEDNVVKFTWISLPADQEFTVSYKFKVDAAMASGKVALGAKFSYVLDNQKQTFELPAQVIMVGEESVIASTTTAQETTAVNTTPAETTATAPAETTATATTTTQENPQTAPTTTVEPTTTAQTTTTTPAQENKTSFQVSAQRTIVGQPEPGAEFTVEIKVQKDGMKGFARIQEVLPAGLTAMSLENKGGTFSFMDQKLKIIWDNLPADEDVVVSYRVLASASASGDMNITGSFSYVENDDPKKVEIPATTINLKTKDVLVTNTTPSVTATAAETTAVSVNNNTTTTTTSNVTSTPAPENNVAFRVQICALSKLQRGSSYFESKYAISGKVSVEFHEGWRKYVTGKFGQYNDARNYREEVKTKGVENPFVTAYNNGKRITVQEALMVSSQKWVP